MVLDWQELTKLTSGKSIVIQKVKILENGVKIEGEFDLPPLARLKMEDQVFAAAFVRSHGSIKQMEKMFGVSYPTIKGRLNEISKSLDFVEIDPDFIEEVVESTETMEPALGVLSRLENGELSIEETINLLKGKE